MKYYYIAISLFVIFTLIQTVNAGNINVNPETVKIPIGGTNTTILTITLDEDDGLNMNHTLVFMIYNKTTGEHTDKLNVDLSSDEVYVEKLPLEYGIVRYKWKPSEVGDYNFTVTLSVGNDVIVGEEFEILVMDSYIQNAIVKISAKSYVYADIIPELSTVVLVALGIIILIRMKLFL